MLYSDLDEWAESGLGGGSKREGIYVYNDSPHCTAEANTT